MSDLLSLPNEILCRIMHSVDLGNLDCFSESCPLFEALAKDFLELHHKRQRKYAHITLQGCQDHKGRHPLSHCTCWDKFAWISAWPGTYISGSLLSFGRKYRPHPMFWGQKSPLFLIRCSVTGVRSQIFVSFLGFLSQEERPKSGAHSMFREQDCLLLP